MLIVFQDAHFQWVYQRVKKTDRHGLRAFGKKESKQILQKKRRKNVALSLYSQETWMGWPAAHAMRLQGEV